MNIVHPFTIHNTNSMKIVLLATACAIAAPVFSQSTQHDGNFAFLQSTATTTMVSLMDSSFHYNTWNSTTNNWNSVLKYIYHYNAFDVQDGEFMYTLMGTSWKNTRNGINYMFDARHNLLERTYEQLVGGNWDIRSREICTYDASDNMLTRLQQENISGVWENKSNIIYTYTGNNMASYMHQTWNTSAGAWVNSVRYSYTYNTNDRIISQALETWTAGAWANNNRLVNFVYVGNELRSYETETWNTTSSAYEAYTKTSNTYDVNHYLLNSITVKWNATTASWDNFSRIDETYDAYGNIASISFQNWDNTSGNWVNAHKSTYFHKTGYVGVNDASSDKTAFAMHPNPASDRITVSISGEGSSSLFITDVSGKTVMTLEANQAGPFSVNIESLEAGLYFMELRNEQGAVTRKFIKN